VLIPETKYERSNSIFSVTYVVLICARMCTQLLQPLVQSLIGSPCTLGTGIPVQKTIFQHHALTSCFRYSKADGAVTSEQPFSPKPRVIRTLLYHLHTVCALGVHSVHRELFSVLGWFRKEAHLHRI